jgi:pimeloyl-ACP methyl ester carboxylesterase
MSAASESGASAGGPMEIRHTTFELAGPDDEVLRGDVRGSHDSVTGSVIVVVHGFKGFKDWGFFPHACETLAEAGHTVVSFNFSHNGIGDDPLEFTELERFAGNTLSRELDELGHVIETVAAGELPGVGQPERVGVLGHSRGGGQAILATAEHESVDALVTWAAVADFDRWSDEVKREWRAEGRFTIMNARTGQEMPLDVGLLEDFEANRERLDILAAARRIDRPWLIVHGRSDETVSPDDGRRLAEAARDGRLILVDGAGHTFEARHPFESSTPELDQALAATREHFRRHLKG